MTQKEQEAIDNAVRYNREILYKDMEKFWILKNVKERTNEFYRFHSLVSDGIPHNLTMRLPAIECDSIAMYRIEAIAEDVFLFIGGESEAKYRIIEWLNDKKLVIKLIHTNINPQPRWLIFEQV